MRLVCPNCDAVYEVDDAVIPVGGRDVQCSNCGNTWFQKSAQQLADEADAPPEPIVAPPSDPAPDSPVAEDAAPEPAPEATPEPTPDPQAASDADTRGDADTDAETPAEDAAPAPDAAEADPAARRALDEDVANVLREEAARETQARQADASGLESQPDLGLTDPPERTDAAGLRDRIARLRGVAPESFESDDAPRRELLPDIEEINSTLRASSDRAGDAGVADAAIPAAAEPVRRRSRFGTGFGLMILLAVILVVIYSMAPLLAAKVPATAPALTAYVEMADGLRVSVNQAVSSGTERLTEFLNGLSGE